MPCCCTRRIFVCPIWNLILLDFYSRRRFLAARIFELDPIHLNASSQPDLMTGEIRNPCTKKKKKLNCNHFSIVHEGICKYFLECMIRYYKDVKPFGGLTSMISERSSTKYLWIEELAASMQRRYSFRAFVAFNLASSYFARLLVYSFSS